MIREALEYEKEAISSGYSALWKDRSVRKRLFLAFVINAGQQITGQGTLNSYSTTIYKKVWTSSSQIALINALNATFAILFTLNAAWTVDRFGRKFLLIVGAVGMSLCMIIVAAVGSETPTPGGAKTQPVGIAVCRYLASPYLDHANVSFRSCSSYSSSPSSTSLVGALVSGSGPPKCSP